MTVNQDLEDVFASEPLGKMDGIDCFVKDDYYWRELGQIEVLTLIEIARSVGWRKAALTLSNKGLVRYITDPIRLRFLDLLAIEEGARILDLGAGWGSLSIQIAKRFPSIAVYAFDRTLEGLVYLDVVRNQEKLLNLRIAKTGADRIPLRDGSMDIVMMIGVLEWVGESITTVPPFIAQREVLSEVRRVLKKGGRLVLGIENRYSYKYLRGKRDHSGIRFGSVFPKRFVSFYSRVALKKEYRTYIYSLGEYKKILTGAGYGDLQFFGAYPDYRFPRVVSDLDSMRDFWKDAHAPGSRVLKQLPNGFLKRIIPSYFIIARK